MRIQRFDGDYDRLAELCGQTASALRDRDERQAQPLNRWVATDGSAWVGTVTTWLRPDRRLFLAFTCHDPAAYRPLTEVARAGGRVRTCTFADAGDRHALDGLAAAGFVVEAESGAFDLPFEALLPRLRTPRQPCGYRIWAADAVDEVRLFALDNTLRQDVLGTDGWVGDPDWFHQELTESPPFDPSGYLVSVDDRTGAYGGLIRVWRNPSGPRLGMLGVLPQYRHTTMAGALLDRALRAAATWGSATLRTETSPANDRTWPRLRALGGEPTSRSVQLVLR